MKRTQRHIRPGNALQRPERSAVQQSNLLAAAASQWPIVLQTGASCDYSYQQSRIMSLTDEWRSSQSRPPDRYGFCWEARSVSEAWPEPQSRVVSPVITSSCRGRAGLAPHNRKAHRQSASEYLRLSTPPPPHLAHVFRIQKQHCQLLVFMNGVCASPTDDFHYVQSAQ